MRSASSREGVKAEGVLDFPVPSGVPDGLSTVVPDNVRRLADDCGLTEREKEILALFAEGRSVPYIAEKFILSPNTVKTHMRRLTCTAARSFWTSWKRLADKLAVRAR